MTQKYPVPIWATAPIRVKKRAEKIFLLGVPL